MLAHAVHIFILGLPAGVVGIVVIYLMWCAIDGRWIRVNIRSALFCMGIAFPICLSLEILTGYVHELIFSRHLWYYTMSPLHDGYTSAYNFAIWPLYGLHLHLYDDVVGRMKLTAHRRRWVDAMKIILSGPLLEILANLLTLIFLGRYYFFYTPSDLGHLTSLQVVPYYALSSCVLMFVLAQLKTKNRSVLLPLGFYLAGLMLLMPSSMYGGLEKVAEQVFSYAFNEIQ